MTADPVDPPPEATSDLVVDLITTCLRAEIELDLAKRLIHSLIFRVPLAIMPDDEAEYLKAVLEELGA